VTTLLSSTRPSHNSCSHFVSTRGDASPTGGTGGHWGKRLAKASTSPGTRDARSGCALQVQKNSPPSHSSLCAPAPLRYSSLPFPDSPLQPGFSTTDFIRNMPCEHSRPRIPFLIDKWQPICHNHARIESNARPDTPLATNQPCLRSPCVLCRYVHGFANRVKYEWCRERSYFDGIITPSA